MDILIVEDEILLGLMLADTLADVGHRVLGPASGRAEALGLVSDRIPHLAFVDIELQAGESGIELAAELRRQGVPCVFATGQPGRAREHGGLALGLVEKPYNPMAIVEVVRYFEALRAGQRPARLPWGLELFGPNASPVPDRLSDTPAPTVVPCATAGSLGPSAAAISAGIAPRTDQGPGDSGVLEALAG